MKPQILPVALVLPAQRKISQADLLRTLGTNRMTLLNWRNLADFPQSEKFGRFSWFKTAEVSEWLRTHGVKVVLI